MAEQFDFITTDKREWIMAARIHNDEYEGMVHVGDWHECFDLSGTVYAIWDDVSCIGVINAAAMYCECGDALLDTLIEELSSYNGTLHAALH